MESVIAAARAEVVRDEGEEEEIGGEDGLGAGMTVSRPNLSVLVVKEGMNPIDGDRDASGGGAGWYDSSAVDEEGGLVEVLLGLNETEP